MFINFWYPAIVSNELVPDRPTRVKMLGRRFTLFRDSAGQARCIADVCIHRGGSLGAGRMRDGEVACPYHGWRFDGAGRCTYIPSMGSDTAIPARAKLDAYPVQEKYGVIFVFLGDLPEHERPPLMECPEYGQPGWRHNLIVFDVACNYERSIENGMDPAHNEFVHPTHGTHGERQDYFVPDIEVEDHDWGCGFMGKFIGRYQDGGEYTTRTAMRTDKSGNFDPDVSAGTWHHGPASMITKIHMAKDNWMHQYMYECPVDEGNIRVFLVNMRNCLLTDEKDQAVADRCVVIAKQDISIVEELTPVRTPPTSTRELLVQADAVISQYRNWLKRWENRGWRIDCKRLHDLEADGNAAFVIPAPARRTEKNWVLATVPLVPPTQRSSYSHSIVAGGLPEIS
jgi:phenylpropionate dioxygenase-like ring-hydroxylating dioxygenase large terminal subunit